MRELTQTHTGINRRYRGVLPQAPLLLCLASGASANVTYWSPAPQFSANITAPTNNRAVCVCDTLTCTVQADADTDTYTGPGGGGTDADSYKTPT